MLSVPDPAKLYIAHLSEENESFIVVFKRKINYNLKTYFTKHFELTILSSVFPNMQGFFVRET